MTYSASSSQRRAKFRKFMYRLCALGLQFQSWICAHNSRLLHDFHISRAKFARCLLGKRVVSIQSSNKQRTTNCRHSTSTLCSPKSPGSTRKSIFSLSVYFVILSCESKWCRVQKCTQHHFFTLSENTKKPGEKRSGLTEMDRVDAEDFEEYCGQLGRLLRHHDLSKAASAIVRCFVCSLLEAISLFAGLLVCARRPCARRMVQPIKISFARVYADTQHRELMAAYRQSTYCRR